MSKVKASMTVLLTGLLVVSVLAMGCPPPRIVPPPPVVELPPPPPVRMGAWVDEIVGSLVTAAVAVPMLEARELDIFATHIADPVVVARVKADPRLGYERVFGMFTELTLNPAGTPENPIFPATGKLNPFAVPRIREAMNWLIDRDYIAKEIYKGLAIPRYFPLHPAFPDYARFIDIARELELYYAHNPAKAEAIITEEMKKLGAEQIGGIWHFQGEPVEIILLIRPEDPRLGLGHYVTRLMEDLGFVTSQLIKTAAEAAPIWLTGDPYDGLYHIYTGGWAATVISRDQGGVFNFFYTPRGIPNPLWLATKPTPEFDELADRLARADYECLEERAAMMEEALKMAMKDSHRVWAANTIGFVPRRADIALAADLAGGIAGSWLWGLTTRFEDPVTGEPKVGGTVRIGAPSILPDPWNPVAGSGWLWDWMFIRPTWDVGAVPDPFTGLWHPQRVERVEVHVIEGLPVGVTLEWVDLKFVPEAIKVPLDAEVDWCAVEVRPITLAEALETRPEWAQPRTTANVKVRVHFPADLFDTVKWHDGTPLDLADFRMPLDRAHEESPIFDPAAVPGHTTFMKHFRGSRIVSEKPLIIEYYTNMTALDAEVIAATWATLPTAPWHTVALGVRAEAAGELAFGTAKAGRLEVEWMNYIAGPTLPILKRHLVEAKAEGWIPYAPFLGKYVTPEEAAARYSALKRWFADKGHFWVGAGPFYLEAAFPIERIVHLKRFPYFPDPAEKWVGFVAPRIAEVDITGPVLVRAGHEAVFDIEVTFEGEPYAVADVDFVTYLVLDARGAIVHVGEAVAVRDGLWQAVLPEQLTAGLVTGSTTLEVVVSPIVVAIPSFGAAKFVLLP